MTTLRATLGATRPMLKSDAPVFLPTCASPTVEGPSKMAPHLARRRRSTKRKRSAAALAKEEDGGCEVRNWRLPDVSVSVGDFCLSLGLDCGHDLSENSMNEPLTPSPCPSPSCLSSPPGSKTDAGSASGRRFTRSKKEMRLVTTTRTFSASSPRTSRWRSYESKRCV